MFSSMSEVQTELMRDRSSSHRHETNDFYPAEPQAGTAAGSGRLGGEPRDTSGSERCPPCRQQPPSREAFTPRFITRHYIRYKMGNRYSLVLFMLWSCSMDWETGREEGSEGAGQREVLQWVAKSTQASSCSNLPRMGFSLFISSLEANTGEQPAPLPRCSHLPKVTVTPPQHLHQAGSGWPQGLQCLLRGCLWNKVPHSRKKCSPIFSKRTKYQSATTGALVTKM